MKGMSSYTPTIIFICKTKIISSLSSERIKLNLSDVLIVETQDSSKTENRHTNMTLLQQMIMIDQHFQQEAATIGFDFHPRTKHPFSSVMVNPSYAFTLASHCLACDTILIGAA